MKECLIILVCPKCEQQLIMKYQPKGDKLTNNKKLIIRINENMDKHECKEKSLN